MTIAITRVGTADVDSGGGGTNGVASFVSVSETWATGDYVLVGGFIEQNSGSDWTFSTTLTPSGGVVATATKVENPGGQEAFTAYLGRVVILAAEVTTGFTGTVTATRTPAGSADHWTAVDFYKMTRSGAITFPRNDADRITTGSTLTTDLGATPDATSALFTVAGGDSGGFAVAPGPFTLPSGWSGNYNAESGGWSGGGVAFHTAWKIGSGTQSNAFTAANATGSGGAYLAVTVEIAEAASGLTMAGSAGALVLAGTSGAFSSFGAVGGPSPVPQPRRRYRRLTS